MERTEQRRRELKAGIIEMTQSELGENAVGEENELSLQDLWLENKGALTFMLRVPQAEEKVGGTERVFKEIVAEKSQIWQKT